MAMEKLESRISELIRDLEMLGFVEDQARARLEGEDEEWNRKVERTTNKIYDLVVSVKPDDPPSKAVHIIGQLIAAVEEMRSPKRIVTEIDNKRKLLHSLQDQKRRQDAARQASKEAYEAHVLAQGG